MMPHFDHDDQTWSDDFLKQCHKERPSEFVSLLTQACGICGQPMDVLLSKHRSSPTCAEYCSLRCLAGFDLEETFHEKINLDLLYYRHLLTNTAHENAAFAFPELDQWKTSIEQKRSQLISLVIKVVDCLVHQLTTLKKDLQADGGNLGPVSLDLESVYKISLSRVREVEKIRSQGSTLLEKIESLAQSIAQDKGVWRLPLTFDRSQARDLLEQWSSLKDEIAQLRQDFEEQDMRLWAKIMWHDKALTPAELVFRRLQSDLKKTGLDDFQACFQKIGKAEVNEPLSSGIYDRIELCKDKCNRLIKEIEEVKAQSEVFDSKEEDENYNYQIRKSLSDEKLKEKFMHDDKAKIEEALKTQEQWTEGHHKASTEEYESQRKQLESVYQPIIMKGGAGTGAGPSGKTKLDDVD